MTVTFDISVRDLARFMQVSPTYVHKMISEQNGEHFGEHFSEHLVGAKAVKVNKLGDKKVNTTVNTLVNTLVNTCSLSSNNSKPSPLEEKNIIIDNNKKETSQVEASPTPPKPEPRVMKRPTLQEVTDYITEKGYDIDPEAFWNFYEANGWKQSNKPIKKWQCCCVTWAKREKNKPTPQPPQRKPLQSNPIIQSYTGGTTHEQYLENQRKAAAAAAIRDEIFNRRLGNRNN